MFLKYIDFIFTPFRKVNNQYLGYKNQVGGVKLDINRSKAMANRGKMYGKNAADKVGGLNAKMNAKTGYDPNAGPGFQQGNNMQQQGGAPGMPGMPPGNQGAPEGMPNPNPPIRVKGWWIFKKKFCTQCEQQLDRTWDACPYCAQMAEQAASAPGQVAALKTQAFSVDSHGGPGSTQLLGWIVPLQGAQRGELFTLSPVSSIGTDEKCTIVLNDKFMSSRHAEIKAENGLWILRDAGSTNGTYVNNRRVERHELVDNDFIKFGSALIKFKSL